MNIFNKVIPWFIPTKEDQKKWYRQELFESKQIREAQLQDILNDL